MKTKLFITGLAFIAITSLASAQNKIASQSQQKAAGQGLAYVDANNNGICDNYENRASNESVGCKNLLCRFNGQGRQGQGQGQRLRNGMGQAQKPGKGLRTGRGRNFVDADKNGVCDYYEAASKK